MTTTYTFGSYKISFDLDSNFKPINIKCTDGIPAPDRVDPEEDGGYEIVWDDGGCQMGGYQMTLSINEKDRRAAIAAGDDASDYMPSLMISEDEASCETFNEDEFVDKADEISDLLTRTFNSEYMTDDEEDD